MAYHLKVKYFNSFWLKKVVGQVEGEPWGPTPGITGGGATTVTRNYGITGNETPMPTWPGVPWNPPGYPSFPWGNSLTNEEPSELEGKQRQWFVEEARIKGGYNNTTVDFGVKAYLVEDINVQQHRSNSLIYSGIFNSRTGINNTNVFSVGEDIVKSVDPVNGSIQKLYSEDTNLVIFQENKVSHALIDKDAVYTAEGSPMQTQSNVVIGQVLPYKGEYGISTNPESFGVYSYQKYFADKNRGAVLRLSQDGLTEISNYGMRDYFRDHLAAIGDQFVPNVLSVNIEDTPTTLRTNELTVTSVCPCCDISPGASLFLIGEDNFNDEPGPYAILGWINTGIYSTNITDNNDGTCKIVFSNFIDPTDYGYDDWASFINTHNGELQLTTYIRPKIIGGYDIHSLSYVLSLQPITLGVVGCIDDNYYDTLNFDEAINGWVSFHSYKPTTMDSLKSNFYSFDDYKLYQHYVDTVPASRGVYYSNYSGSHIEFVFNPKPSIVKNFQTVGYEGSNGWQIDTIESDPTEFTSIPVLWSSWKDSAAFIASYDQGAYVDPSDNITYRAGFSRKENKYVSNLINSGSSIQVGEVLDGTSMSGIKGYFTTVRISTDNQTDIYGIKELYEVSSKWVISSY